MAQYTDENGIQWQCLQLVRTCPGCNRTYHQSARLNRASNRVSLTCVDCGHSWRGRYRQDEWEQWKD